MKYFKIELIYKYYNLQIELIYKYYFYKNYNFVKINSIFSLEILNQRSIISVATNIFFYIILKYNINISTIEHLLHILYVLDESENIFYYLSIY